MKKIIAMGIAMLFILVVPMSIYGAISDPNWTLQVDAWNPAFSNPYGNATFTLKGSKTGRVICTVSKSGYNDQSNHTTWTSPVNANGIYKSPNVTGPTYASSGTKFTASAKWTDSNGIANSKDGISVSY